MQDNYVSLNPANTIAEERAIRSRLYAQRLLEAQGGASAVIVGAQWGLTASVLTYSSMQNSGFAFLPLTMKRSQGYAKIGGAFLAFYMLGHGYVMGRFGDRRQFNHLYLNKSGILAGTTAWDRQD